MPETEAERIALQLQELAERRSRLQGVIAGNSKLPLDAAELADVQRALEAVEREQGELRRRLRELPGSAAGE